MGEGHVEQKWMENCIAFNISLKIGIKCITVVTRIPTPDMIGMSNEVLSHQIDKLNRNSLNRNDRTIKKYSPRYVITILFCVMDIFRIPKKYASHRKFRDYQGNNI